MTELEFEVLDELYFVTSFMQLKEALGISEEDLKETLSTLFQKKWISCFAEIDMELEEQAVDIKNQYKSYFYLATKKGLLKHNTE